MAASTLEAPTSRKANNNGGSRPMLGATVAGVGALLAVVAGMVHFYVAPSLAVAPADQDSMTYLSAKDATVFDTKTLAPITTDLSVAAHTIGDVTASKKAPGDTVVWMNNTTITSSDGVIRSQSQKRAAFDAKTGAAVNCCDNFYESVKGERTKVNRSGLIYKFPFNTDKKTYTMWDDTAAKAVRTSYTGTSSVDGTKVYIFSSTVPAQSVGNQTIPASLLGLTGADVSADSMYQNSTKYYVEPITGAIMNQVTDTKSWFSYDGHELVTNDAHLSYTPKEIKDMHSTVGSKPGLLALAQGFLPWVVLLLGLVMVTIGTGLARRRVA
ncbi:MAG TPA: DUF3068 domain-containing protein [Marmoricola sp.]|jgi:hypothetical protein|nr:DUF3068 domain-containing protein [Marmoricola sp.]